MNLGNLTTPEVAATAAHTVLVIPLGATEQHGPHLPLDTDTVIAVELCRRLAERLPTIRIAPPSPTAPAANTHTSPAPSPSAKPRCAG